MSGGAYALLGMQLGDVLLNWERKSAPYRLPRRNGLWFLQVSGHVSPA